MIIMKNDSELKRKLISLIIATFAGTLGLFKNEIVFNNQKVIGTNKVIAMETMAIYSIDKDLNDFINENNEVFDFYANMFGISMDDLKASIINDNNGSRLNHNDIGNTKKEYNSLDKNLVEYLFSLKKSNSKLFKQKYESNNKSKEYIYGLISYFSSVYGNVDQKVLSSIAYIESGNLNSKYMMSCNNIYGGMSSSGLIKHANIEYGVLSYVRMMSLGYYGKGLNTVEKIAKKYNNNSKTWIYNVNKTMEKFNDIKSITNIQSLNELK